MGNRKHLLNGRRFGALVVQSETKIGRRLFAICLCDCGNTKQVRVDHLIGGDTTRCCPRPRKPRSEYTVRCRTPEYDAWANIKARCSNLNSASWRYYGGRGIKVCERWQGSFQSFLADMGRKPTPSHSIDRIDVDGDYEPGNCRWATAKEQAANRRPIRRAGKSSSTAAVQTCNETERGR